MRDKLTLQDMTSEVGSRFIELLDSEYRVLQDELRKQGKIDQVAHILLEILNACDVGHRAVHRLEVELGLYCPIE